MKDSTHAILSSIVTLSRRSTVVLIQWILFANSMVVEFWLCCRMHDARNFEVISALVDPTSSSFSRTFSASSCRRRQLPWKLLFLSICSPFLSVAFMERLCYWNAKPHENAVHFNSAFSTMKIWAAKRVPRIHKAAELGRQSAPRLHNAEFFAELWGDTLSRCEIVISVKFWLKRS